MRPELKFEVELRLYAMDVEMMLGFEYEHDLEQEFQHESE